MVYHGLPLALVASVLPHTTCSCTLYYQRVMTSINRLSLPIFRLRPWPAQWLPTYSPTCVHILGCIFNTPSHTSIAEQYNNHMYNALPQNKRWISPHSHLLTTPQVLGLLNSLGEHISRVLLPFHKLKLELPQMASLPHKMMNDINVLGTL